MSRNSHQPRKISLFLDGMVVGTLGPGVRRRWVPEPQSDEKVVRHAAREHPFLQAASLRSAFRPESG
jgi:hypothetical protein